MELFRLRVRNHSDSHLLSSLTWRGEVGLTKEQSILRLKPQKERKMGGDPNGRPPMAKKISRVLDSSVSLSIREENLFTEAV